MIFKDKIAEELWNSECPKDYIKTHRFEKIGIIEDGSDVSLVWKCQQCNKCLMETLIFLDFGDDAFRMSEEQEKARKTIQFFFKKIKDHTKISRKKFYLTLHQVYYLAQEEFLKGRKEVKG